jgi:hypothetical protein
LAQSGIPGFKAEENVKRLTVELTEAVNVFDQLKAEAELFNLVDFDGPATAILELTDNWAIFGGAVDEAKKKVVDFSKENILFDKWFGDVDAYETATNKIKDLTEENIGKDFWQIKAEERYQVQSRGIEAMIEAENKFSDDLIKLTERTAWAMQSNFSNFFFDVIKGELNSLSDYVDAFLNTLQRSMADYLGQMATEGLIGMLPKVGGGGGLVNWIGSLFGGGSVAGTTSGRKAAGGPVSAGLGYVVGERGPEVFVPGRSGSIVPNDKIGGSKVTIIVNNNTGAETSQRTAQGSDGGEQVIIDIGANDVITGGNLARAMEGTYNLKRAGRM